MHPLRNHTELGWGNRYAEKWKYVWMRKLLPKNQLHYKDAGTVFSENMHKTVMNGKHTFLTLSKSSVS